MEILHECVQDKSLTVPEKTLDGKNPWKKIYDGINDVYVKQSDL